MTTQAQSAVIEPCATAASECEQALALLRQQGADHWWPVDFHYMEALARRMGSQAPNVRRILEAKLQLAIKAYQNRFENAQRNGVTAPHQAAIAQPPAPSALGQLVHAMAYPIAGVESSNRDTVTGSRPELKSVRQYRNTWSQLSAQKQVAQALGQAPKNAGPINSHMLVLRSLELMRDIAPDYLNRFMAYADTLLCLEQTDQSAKASEAKPLASVKLELKPKPNPRAKPKVRAPARA